MRTFWKFNLIAWVIIGVIMIFNRNAFSDRECLMAIVWIIASLLGNTIFIALDELKKGSIIKIEIKDNSKNKQFFQNEQINETKSSNSSNA